MGEKGLNGIKGLARRPNELHCGSYFKAQLVCGLIYQRVSDRLVASLFQTKRRD